MVSKKAIENEMLPKAIESINKNFNVVVQDLAETKNIVKALNDQLTVGEEKKKTLELERDNLLKEKEICQINNLPNYKQNFLIRRKQ